MNVPLSGSSKLRCFLMHEANLSSEMVRGLDRNLIRRMTVLEIKQKTPSGHIAFRASRRRFKKESVPNEKKSQNDLERSLSFSGPRTDRSSEWRQDPQVGALGALQDGNNKQLY